MNRLPAQEWLVIFIIIAILGLVVFVTLIQNSSSLPATGIAHEPLPSTIEVHIEGAVRHPGLYVFPVGTRLEEALEQAEPLPEAHLSRLKKQRILRDGQKIKVPAKATLTIFLKGAVKQEESIQVLEGARLEDLIQLADLSDQADIAKLKKRRLLKDQEVVYIPEKKVKAKKARTKKSKKEKDILDSSSQ
jgi:protein involved in polysaccharide export with SLBB domain